MTRVDPLGEKANNLLKVLEHPETVNLSVTAICKQAGLSRESYYYLMNDVDYQQRIRSHGLGLAVMSVPKVIRSLIRQSQSNPQACQTLLRLAALGDLDTLRLINEGGGGSPTADDINELKKLTANLEAVYAGQPLDSDKDNKNNHKEQA